MSLLCPHCAEPLDLPEDVRVTPGSEAHDQAHHKAIGDAHQVLRCKNCQQVFDTAEQAVSSARQNSVEPEVEKTKQPAPVAFQFHDPTVSSGPSDRPLGPSGCGPEVAKRATRESSLLGGMLSLLKIVLGGAAGLVIGQLVLWWLPVPYRNDPLDVAPLLPEQLGFLAPPELRHPGLARTNRNDDPEAPPFLDQDISVDRDLSQADDNQVNYSTNSDGGAASAENGGLDERASLDSTLATPVPAPVSAAALRSSLSFLQIADTALATQKDAEPIRQWYQAFCDVAKLITYADVTDPQIPIAADEVAAYVVSQCRDEQRKKHLASGAAAWLRDDERHQQGIVLVGHVTEIETAGEFFVLKVRIFDKRKTLATVVSQTDPRLDDSRPLHVGTDAVLLGVVLRRPKRVVPTYPGPELVIVWGGLPVLLAQEP